MPPRCRALRPRTPDPACRLLDILTVQESYRRYLLRCTSENPLLPGSAAFAEARFQLENNYWNQPADQLGGVRGTLYNFLVPFAEPEIAEVFCRDSTLDLRDVGRARSSAWPSPRGSRSSAGTWQPS